MASDLAKRAADVGAVTVGAISAPFLRFVARRRYVLPRFQRFADAQGFAIRPTTYYEPTYAETHLPPTTDVERTIPGLDLRERAQLELLGRFTFADELAAIPEVPPDPASPRRFGYRNDMFSYGDAEAYYSLIRLGRPRRIVEIGSGFSTLAALQAIEAGRSEDSSYACKITCIEPYESGWLEATGAEVVRARVETLPLDMFDALDAGDILFIDSSHVVRPWGDVLREIHEIVPRVAPGVLVHFHDIFTPRDYPETWLRSERRLWNEQYLLEAFLAFNPRFEVVLAMNWLAHRHRGAAARAFPMLGEHPEAEPGSFWIRAK